MKRGSAARLRRRRALTAASLWVERLLPALGPSLAVLCGLVVMAGSGVLPAGAGSVPAGVALIGALGWAAMRVRRIEPPCSDAIDRRLERDDPHQPLATLADRPALPGAEVIWQAHRQRALARLDQLRAAPPRWGRGGAGLVAIIGLAGLSLAVPRGAHRVWQAVVPAAAGVTVRVEAWIVPPARTGLGPIFLHPGRQSSGKVPIGSALTVAVLGGNARPVLRYGLRRVRFARLEAGRFQAGMALDEPGTLDVSRWGRSLGRWRIAVGADQPPVIALAGPAAVNERQLSLPWRASDDYGLDAVIADIRLPQRPDAAPLLVTNRLPGLPREAGGAALPDLTAHPWAGLAVRVRYLARDGSGQMGASGEALAVLPERAFLNPLARALVLARRRLTVAPDATAQVALDLDRLGQSAAERLSPGQWLALRTVTALLADQPDRPEEAQARLWQLALAIEDAGAENARQRMNAARDALRDVLQASPRQEQQMESLSEALRQAMRRYVEALQHQAEEAGQTPPEQADGQPIDPGQIEQMARAMEEAAKAGRMEEARQRLEALGQMLDRLRPGGRQAGNDPPAKADPALEQLRRDQAGLRGHTDQRLSGGQGGAPQRTRDGQAQLGLRQRLGDRAAALGADGQTIPQGLAQADGAMRDAAAALARGDDAAAREAQQRALDGLDSAGPKGGQQSAGSPNGTGPPRGRQTDPLGRPLQPGPGASPDTEDTVLPSQQDAARQRALRDELRRRAADRTRPPAELEYIDRLLNGTR